MSRNHYAAVLTLKATGERVFIQGRLKWGKMYYTVDDWETQATTKSEAIKAAREAGNKKWFEPPETPLKLTANAPACAPRQSLQPSSIIHLAASQGR